MHTLVPRFNSVESLGAYLKESFTTHQTKISSLLRATYPITKGLDSSVRCGCGKLSNFFCNSDRSVCPAALVSAVGLVQPLNNIHG